MKRILVAITLVMVLAAHAALAAPAQCVIHGKTVKMPILPGYMNSYGLDEGVDAHWDSMTSESNQMLAVMVRAFEMKAILDKKQKAFTRYYSFQSPMMREDVAISGEHYAVLKKALREKYDPEALRIVRDTPREYAFIVQTSTDGSDIGKGRIPLITGMNVMHVREMVVNLLVYAVGGEEMIGPVVKDIKEISEEFFRMNQ
ncbi:hypothetical protein [Salidesulfovibrio brasiliensis]|uniref:hypothetical protein n=1 Tax=Salidesulfovibrio brasiliensis TaxID=221711 RepID=UPI0006D0325D|nr:hypothetical protein [Salidesulfovibrio brasiliensis]